MTSKMHTHLKAKEGFVVVKGAAKLNHNRSCLQRLPVYLSKRSASSNAPAARRAGALTLSMCRPTPHAGVESM